MAESGFFRLSLRGFNKKEVLQYIDELQTTHAQRLTEEEELRLELENTLESERESAAQQVARLETLEQTNVQLSDKVEKLTALAQIYKAELLSLREQAVSGEKAQITKNELDLLHAQKQALEAQVTLLKEQNSRYATVVGDVNRIVMEARVVSASYLDTAHQKSTECIEELDSFLSKLKGQVEKVREDTVAHRKSGDLHIESLLEELQELGQSIPSNK